MRKEIIFGKKELVGEWVALHVGRSSPWENYEAIGLAQDRKLIAGVVFDSHVPGARCAMHVAGLGKSWLNRDFLWTCFHYAFVQLDCKVVVGLVDADNEQALKFDKHLGFSEVCRIEDGAGDCDLVVLTMPRRTCRWLNLKRAQR